MKTLFSFDWLRFTAPTRDALGKLIETFPQIEIDDEVVAGRGAYTVGQHITLEGRRAGLVEWNPQHPEFKVSYTFTGRDLLAWRENTGPGDLVRFVLEWEYNITRIDLALDILDGGDLEDVARAVESGKAKTRTTSRSVIRSSSADSQKGLTVYIGSRQSDKFMRVYHKGAQMGTDDEWTRVELEAKGNYAKMLATRLAGLCSASQGHSEWWTELTKLSKSEMRALLTCDVDWYQRALSDAEVPLVTVERKRQKSEKWAFTTLLEMVRNTTREFPEWGAVAIKTIQHELDRE